MPSSNVGHTFTSSSNVGHAFMPSSNDTFTSSSNVEHTFANVKHSLTQSNLKQTQSLNIKRTSTQSSNSKHHSDSFVSARAAACTVSDSSAQYAAQRVVPSRKRPLQHLEKRSSKRTTRFNISEFNTLDEKQEEQSGHSVMVSDDESEESDEDDLDDWIVKN
jgi:hypothetical protein